MARKKKTHKVVGPEMVYSFRAGFRCKVDAQVVGEELERIRERDGGLKTETVVDEARPEIAPLHPAFEWDDFAAAEHYRKIQARTMIRKVRVSQPDYAESDSKDTRDAPAFVHVRLAREQAGYYQKPDIVVNNVDEFEAAMSEALGKLGAAQRAVSELEQIAIGSKDKDRLAMVTIACRALETANNALRVVH
jgi:hypothetical protein